MGACNSSAALDPADITADGTAPVFWSPEREQEKRAAKLREIQLKQQAEIERATGHLKQKQRRRTTSKSVPDEEKQSADASTTATVTEKVQAVQSSPALVRASSRPVSVSLPSTPVRHRQHTVISDEELSDYPVPKSARRMARATSASIASPTRSPEVSVSAGRRSDSELSSTPRHQSTPMAGRRSSAVPDSVKEEEQKQAEEEKECEASTPLPPSITTATPAPISAAPIHVVTLRPVATLREEKVQEVDKPSVATASAAFGVSLRKTPSVRAADMTVPSVSVVAAC